MPWRSRSVCWTRGMPSSPSADRRRSASIVVFWRTTFSGGSPRCWSLRPHRDAAGLPDAWLLREKRPRGKNDAGRPDGRPASCQARVDSGLRNVFGGRSLGPLHDVEFDRVTLGQRLEPASLDRAVMHEAVFLAAICLLYTSDAADER